MTVDLKNIRFLVVEDQPEPARVLTTLLKDMGAMEVFTASDGEAALTLLGSLQDIVDRILCDWMMPKLSGFEVLKFVRQERPNMPFIMITAYVDEKSIEFARGAGVNAYITKPFSIENVESVILDIVRQL